MDKRRYFTRKILNALLTIVLMASSTSCCFASCPATRRGSWCPKGITPWTQWPNNERIPPRTSPCGSSSSTTGRTRVQLKFGDSFAQSGPWSRWSAGASGRRWSSWAQARSSPRPSVSSPGYRRVAAQQQVRRDRHQLRHDDVLHADLLGLPHLHHDTSRREAALVPGRAHVRPRRGLHELVQPVHRADAPPLPAGLHLRHHLHGRVPTHHAQLADRRDARRTTSSPPAPRACPTATCSGSTSCPTPCCRRSHWS